MEGVSRLQMNVHKVGIKDGTHFKGRKDKHFTSLFAWMAEQNTGYHLQNICSNTQFFITKLLGVKEIPNKNHSNKSTSQKKNTYTTKITPQLFQIYLALLKFSWHPFETALVFHFRPAILITPEKWAMQVVWSKEDLSSCGLADEKAQEPTKVYDGVKGVIFQTFKVYIWDM